MKREHEVALYTNALVLWGDEAQILMAIEEMAEATTRLAQHLRGRTDPGATAEEIADAQIMLAQMELVFDGVAEWRERKLERLQERVRKAIAERKPA